MYKLSCNKIYCVTRITEILEWQTSASKTTGDQSIVGESPTQSLKFSCVRKLSMPLFGDDSKAESQQNYLSKNLGIPKKLALMAFIRANAELKEWDAIEHLLVSKVSRKTFTSGN